MGTKAHSYTERLLLLLLLVSVMDEGDEEGAFNQEEVLNIMNKVVASALGSQSFVHSKVQNWVNTIVENCLKELTVLNDESAQKGTGLKFKYIVTCALQQKTGAGFQSSTMCYWDKATDGFTSLKWESDAMQALCTVYGV